jgi:aldehyde dehydrogenase (NAD+)
MIVFDPDQTSVPAGHFIDGRLVVEGVERMLVRRPSDGGMHGDIPLGDDRTVHAAATAAARAQPAWAATAPRARAAVLRRWAELIDANLEEIARLEALVSTRFFHEALGVDVRNSAEWIRFYAEYCDKLDGAVLPTASTSLALTTRTPYGVVGAIAPWNFPLVLAIWKVAPALAAGNAVVLKPSELTPFSVVRVAELAVEAGLPRGLFNVVLGEGPVVGRAIVRHPLVSCVAFTGSTATGRRVMVDAAESGPKPVGLELGGKGPQLVLADAEDLDAVSREVAWGVTRNAGQLCYAGSRLVVHRSLADELVERVAARMQALVPGPTWDDEATLAPILNEKQAARIEDLVGQTLAQGASLRLGGHRLQQPGDGIWFAPTILEGVVPEMAGCREEVFGPVLAVQRFDDEEEGLALADHPDYGLSASVYSASLKGALRAAQRLQAGSVWVNGWGRKPDFTAPFGGWKASGLGLEAGRAGYEKFLRQKTIWLDL